MRCRNCRRIPTAEEIQNVVYEIGRREPFLDAVKKGKDGRPGVSLDWFNMLYQVLLGQEKGPRFGSFVAVYGLGECGRHDRRRAGAVGVTRGAFSSFSPCGRRWREAPDEGSLSADRRTPHPSRTRFVRPCHPLPHNVRTGERGRREEVQ